MTKMIIALAMLGALLAIGSRSDKIPLLWQLLSLKTIEDTDPAPQDVVYTMLDAASVGDSETFIACFSGDTERRLRQTQIEMTRTRFSHYLMSTYQTIKGVAMEGLVLVSDREVNIWVDYVYQDRTVAQRITLTREARNWKITRLENSWLRDPYMSYGTPVR